MISFFPLSPLSSSLNSLHTGDESGDNRKTEIITSLREQEDWRPGDRDPETAAGYRHLAQQRRLTPPEREAYWTAVLGPRLPGPSLHTLVNLLGLR